MLARNAAAFFALVSCFVCVSFAQDASDPVGTPANSGGGQVTASVREGWFVSNTVGPASLLGGVVSAGFGTLVNAPSEYGTHWKGFGKRYGMRFTGIATSNAMEAGLGSLWGEDPRYQRTEGLTFGKRVVNVVKMAFLSQDSNGALHPAYARYIAIGGSNFLSNTWRADSEANSAHATARIGLGFLGRISGNAFSEFWPDVRSRLHRKHDADN